MKVILPKIKNLNRFMKKYCKNTFKNFIELFLSSDRDSFTKTLEKFCMYIKKYLGKDILSIEVYNRDIFLKIGILLTTYHVMYYVIFTTRYLFFFKKYYIYNFIINFNEIRYTGKKEIKKMNEKIDVFKIYKDVLEDSNYNKIIDI